MMRYRGSRAGVTLIELLVVVGIMMGMYLLTGNNLTRLQRANISQTTLDTLVADMALTQNRSMTGDTSSGTSNASYGIYFQSDRYTLFKGSSFVANDPENFVVMLSPTLQFASITFPSSQIVYQAASGAYAGYTAGQNTVVLQDNEQNISKTLHVNSLGVIESVD